MSLATTFSDQPIYPERCERFWKLWDRMMRAAEKLELARCKDAGKAEIEKAAEKKSDAILVMGYHLELCEICQEWWGSFQRSAVSSQQEGESHGN